MVCVDGKEYLVHRLVATAFLGPPPTELHTVDHVDRDPSNNAVSNLRWASRSEQTLNQGKHGRKRDTERVRVTWPSGATATFDSSQAAADAAGCTKVVLCQAARTGCKANGCTAEYVAGETQEIEGEAWRDYLLDAGLKVSSLGRIQRVRNRGSGWGFKVTPKPTKDQQGYVHVSVGNKKMPVHRLVMLTFVGPSSDPSKTTVDHVNFDRADNRLCNLRWASRTEQNRSQQRYASREVGSKRTVMVAALEESADAEQAGLLHAQQGHDYLRDQLFRSEQEASAGGQKQKKVVLLRRTPGSQYAASCAREGGERCVSPSLLRPPSTYVWRG